MRKVISVKRLEKTAKEVALLTLKISYLAKTGHVGSALSISDILTVLYFSYLNVTKATTKLKKRDRFILSKGHAAASLYAVLYKRGVLTKKQLLSFGQNGGLCEHPEIQDPGIELSTGSLGHGLAFGIGAALAQKMERHKSRTVVLISDGECDEGSVWESALLASRFQLSNLTVIIDYNKWQCFGRVDDVTIIEPLRKKWDSFGWDVIETDGHDVSEISRNLFSIPKGTKPSLVIAHTVSGKRIPLIEDKLAGHYKVFSQEEYRDAYKQLQKR